MKRDKIFKFLDSCKLPIQITNEIEMKKLYEEFKKKTEEKSTVYYFFYLMCLEWDEKALAK